MFIFQMIKTFFHFVYPELSLANLLNLDKSNSFIPDEFDILGLGLIQNTNK